MNYFAFLSVGVFAALFSMIAAHYLPEESDPRDYSPSNVLAAIEKDQREKVLIARDTHGIKVDETVVAKWEGEKINRFASIPTPAPKVIEPVQNPANMAAFSVDAWFRYVREAFHSFFSANK